MSFLIILLLLLLSQLSKEEVLTPFSNRDHDRRVAMARRRWRRLRSE